MTYTAIEAEIRHGQIVVKEPEKLPEAGRGVFILLSETPDRPRKTVKLPLIKGSGDAKIDPTPEELDASLWD